MPIYQPLLEELRQEVLSREIDPGAPVTTESELVRTRNLTRKTVRRAVDQLVVEGLIERRAGKGLFKKDRSFSTARQLVEIIIPNMQHDMCIKIVRGAQEAGRQQGISVHVYDAHGSLQDDLDMIRSLPERAPGGAIIVMLYYEGFAEVLYELKARNYPFVLVDGRLHDIQVPSVLADNYDGGYQIGKALHQLGHRVVSCIGHLKAETVKARCEGLRDAFLDAGSLFSRHWIHDLDVFDPIGDWTDAIESCVHKVLSQTPRPTALFMNNDDVCVTLYPVLAALNLRVPQDISVVGFDDNKLCTLLTPSLSTVSQPTIDMGRVAMDLLIAQKNSPNGTDIKHHVLKTQWIQRDSVGPAPVQ